MTEDSKRVWDVATGVLSPILTSLALIFTVYQFRFTETHKLEYEHNAKLWDARILSYQDISTRAGRVVAHADSSEFERYANDFSEVYYGPSLLSEDRDVEEQMVLFKTEINNFLNKVSSKDQLIIRANSLIKACRTSVAKASLSETTEIE